MTRRKKQPREMTNDELLRHVFPKQAVPHIKNAARRAEKPQVKGSERAIKDKDT